MQRLDLSCFVALVIASTSLISAAGENVILERGQDHAVLGSIEQGMDSEGNTIYRTNQFTLLENGLNYLDNGEWKLSEDVIEPFAEGAVARKGPHKAIFSNDLNAEAVFDIESSDGKRLRGGVRSIILRDTATGLTLPLAEVKPQAPGELLPPNRIVYRDAFEGLIRADVLLVWRHNSFAQDVILRTRPTLPAEMTAESTRLEVITEFIQPPEPELRTGVGEFPDHALINFGVLAIITGYAYPVEDGASLGGPATERKGTMVAKQWHSTPDGRTFLVESIPWKELLPHLQHLEVAQVVPEKKPIQMAMSRWPAAKVEPSGRAPIKLASAPYQPTGHLIDFEVITATSTVTEFLGGVTYAVVQNYYIGTQAIFRPGAVIKVSTLHSIVAYGTVSFPDTLQNVVFTAIDDDSFGEKITGNSNPYVPASDGDPSDSYGDDAFRIWYVTSSSEVRNALFRWCQNGIEYFSTGSSANHTVRNCRFEKMHPTSGTAIALAYVPSSRTVTFITSEKWDVTADAYPANSSQVVGSLSSAVFRSPVSFQGMRRNDSDEYSPLVPVPDTMGAVGPSHFVELLNVSMAVFDKTGTRLTIDRSASLFQESSGQIFDPRILYDPDCSRWVAAALYNPISGPRSLILAVSYGSDPVPLNTSWQARIFDVRESGESDFLVDFPTLGMDKNGYYIAINLYYPNLSSPTAWRQKVVAIKKPTSCGSINLASNVTLVSTTLSSSTTPASYKWLTLQPVVNYDFSIAATAPAYFLGKDTPISGGGNIRYGKITWSGSVPAFTWENASLDLIGTYHDLDDQTSIDSLPPQKGPAGVNPVKLVLGSGTVGSRLMNAFSRKIGTANYIWTTHHVGVNSSGTDTSPDRSAVQWTMLYVAPSGTLAVDDGGKIYDTSSDAYFFYHPSLAVNSSGNLLIGYSGSRSSEYIGAFYSGILWGANIPTRTPTLIQRGRHYFDSSNWGHYSHTTIDPSDGSFWTIQEYAETPTSFACFGTWISKITISN